MRIRSENATSYAIFWMLTHVVAALHVMFGGLLYFSTDYSIDPARAPFKCGMLKTSVSDSGDSGDFLDPISILFSKGERCMKLSNGVVTLILSKLYVQSSVQVTKFHAALFLSILIVSIPCWYLNTLDDLYFETKLYYKSMRMSSVLVALLLSGWFLSSVQSPPLKMSLVERNFFHLIACFFLLLGGIFGMQLLVAPEAYFGPNGLMPFFTVTTTPDNTFDPVMLYSARMFGMAHMPFFVTFYYSLWHETAVSALLYQATTCSLFLPIDIMIGFGLYQNNRYIYNQPIFLAFAFLHAIAILATGKAVSVVTKKHEKLSNSPFKPSQPATKEMHHIMGTL